MPNDKLSGLRAVVAGGSIGGLCAGLALCDGGADVEGLDIEAGLRELQAKLPGMLETNEYDQPGMHTTDTVDMEIVISGEIVLELDDGVETTLRPGDVNIQNGTRHRWHNRGSEPAVLAVAMVGLPRAT